MKSPSHHETKYTKKCEDEEEKFVVKKDHVRSIMETVEKRVS